MIANFVDAKTITESTLFITLIYVSLLYRQLFLSINSK